MKPKISIIRQFEFEAAHYLPGYDGPCSNLHGHTYKLQIEIQGEIQDQKMIMDFSILKEIIYDHIINKLDHNLLNKIWFYPSAENMTGWIWDILSSQIKSYNQNLLLSRVRLYETSNSFCEAKI